MTQDPSAGLTRPKQVFGGGRKEMWKLETGNWKLETGNWKLENWSNAHTSLSHRSARICTVQ